MSAAEWTKPYHGVQHLGRLGVKRYWVTVTDRGRFAELYRHFPDCGFSPEVTTHKTAALARRAGRAYMRRHAHLNPA